MEDRFTVKLEPDLEAARREALADEVARAFGLSREEAQTLLKAETLVLARHEAHILAGLCRKLGIEAVLAAPPRRRAPRGLWLALLSAGLALVLGLTAALVWPRVAEPGDAGTQAPDEAAQSRRVIEPVAPTVPGQEPPPPDLFAAARELDALEVRRALAAAEVDLQDAYGQTPLMYAAGSNGPEVLEVLLASGAQVNAQSNAGWTALMYAARNDRYPEVAARLLAAGADPSLRNESGQTARDIALAYNNTAVAEQLSLQPAAESPAPAPEAGAEPTSEPSLEPDAALPRITVQPAPDPAPASQPAVRTLPRTAPLRPADPQDEANRELIERCLADWDACGD